MAPIGRRSKVKGVQFTIMVVGAYSGTYSLLGLMTVSLNEGVSGTGRTTFVNTLCDTNLLPHKVCDSPETAHQEEGIRIRPVNVGQYCYPNHFFYVAEARARISELEEDGVRIALTVVDTPGFGDNINNESACVLLIPYTPLPPDTSSNQIPRNHELPRTAIRRHSC